VYHLDVAERSGDPAPQGFAFGRHCLWIIDCQSRSVKSTISLVREQRANTLFGRRADKVIRLNPGQRLMMISQHCPYALLSLDAEEIWTYAPPSGKCYGSMTEGDVDGDGATEFYVTGYNGLIRLDGRGRKVWGPRGPWMWEVDVYKGDKRHAPCVVTLENSSPRKLRMWSARGDLLRQVSVHTPIMGLQVCNWPQEGCILTKTNNSLVIIDMDGNVIIREFIAEWGPIMRVMGTPVKFHPEEPPYFAVLADFQAGTDRSLLVLFSPGREVVYKEVLRETTGICPLKLNPPEGESLLVGGRGKIWEYQALQDARGWGTRRNKR